MTVEMRDLASLEEPEGDAWALVHSIPGGRLMVDCCAGGEFTSLPLLFETVDEALDVARPWAEGNDAIVYVRR